MDKKKSNYKRIIELGEWLESFIDPNISYRQFYRLVKQSIDILAIDFHIDETDLSLQIIKAVDNLPPNLKKKYLDPVQNKTEFKTTDWFVLGNNFLINELDEDKQWGDTPQPVADAVNTIQDKYDTCLNRAVEIATAVTGKEKDDFLQEHPWNQACDYEIINLSLPAFDNQLLQSNKELMAIIDLYKKLVEAYEHIHIGRWVDMIKPHLMQAYQLRPVLNYLLEKIATSSQHWVDSLTYLEQKDNLKTKEIMSQYKVHSIFFFKNKYSDLVECLSLKDGTIKVIRNFSRAHNELLYPDLPTVLPWIVIVSRIFFDFFILGGQDYLSRCQQCGCINITQRKGRKKFCSDGCRLDHFRAKKSTHIS